MADAPTTGIDDAVLRDIITLSKDFAARFL